MGYHNITLEQVLGAGGRLAQGKRVVTADDFIVDDDEVEYETASSESQFEHVPEEDPDEELEQNWVDWAEGEDVDEKLRDVLETKGLHHFKSCMGTYLQLTRRHWYSAWLRYLKEEDQSFPHQEGRGAIYPSSAQ